jgi:hypothetical protein
MGSQWSWQRAGRRERGVCGKGPHRPRGDLPWSDRGFAPGKDSAGPQTVTEVILHFHENRNKYSNAWFQQSVPTATFQLAWRHMSSLYGVTQWTYNGEHTFKYVRFQVLTAVVMKSSIFWDITPSSLLKVNRRFGGTCYLHFQVRRLSRARNQCESRWQEKHREVHDEELHKIFSSPHIIRLNKRRIYGRDM